MPCRENSQGAQAERGAGGKVFEGCGMGVWMCLFLLFLWFAGSWVLEEG